MHRSNVEVSGGTEAANLPDPEMIACQAELTSFFNNRPQSRLQPYSHIQHLPEPMVDVLHILDAGARPSSISDQGAMQHMFQDLEHDHSLSASGSCRAEHHHLSPESNISDEPGPIDFAGSSHLCPLSRHLKSAAAAHMPYAPQVSSCSDHASPWITPACASEALQTDVCSLPEHMACEGLVSPMEVQSYDGSELHSFRSHSSHSSILTQVILTEELVEPAWVINRELQSIIVQALVDEQQSAIDPDYLRFHSQHVQQDGDWITPSMRYMTVTWMSEAIDDLRLSQSVCFMAITLLDRYLSSARVFPSSMLQLAAGTCMFVAAKIAGVLPHPPASAFVALAAGAFELDDVVLFERILCQTLCFNLCGPTVHDFLTLFESTLGDPGSQLVEYMREHTHHMACFLLELTLCSYGMLQTPRHVLTVAALILAYSDRGLLHHVAKSGDMLVETVERYALECIESFRKRFSPDISVSSVAQCCGEMLSLVHVSAGNVEEPFVVQKFRMPKYCSVARISRPISAEELQCAIFTYVNQGQAPAQKTHALT